MSSKTFMLLIWKSYRLRRYHWVTTLLEFCLPILLAFFMMKFLASEKKYVLREPHIYPILIRTDLLEKANSIPLVYTPSNEFTDKLMDSVQGSLELKNSKVIRVSSEEEMELFLANERASVGIVFHDVGPFVQVPRKLKYDLRNHREWHTAELYDPSVITKYELPNAYFAFGIVAIQLLINEEYIHLMSTETFYTIREEMKFQAIPYPEYTANDKESQQTMSQESILDAISYIVLFAVTLLSVVLIYDVIEEKESGVKEMLKLTGIDEWIIWMGWFVHAFFVSAVSLTIVAIMLKYPFHGEDSENLHFVTFPVLWIVLILYCIANISYCFMFCAIFHQAAVASSLFMISFIVIFVGMKYLEKRNVSYVATISCIFPFGAFIHGFRKIRYFEILGVRFNWLSISFTGNDNLDVSLSFVFMMLLFDTFFYALLAFYITVINPGRFGVGKSPYFVFESLFFPIEDDAPDSEKFSTNLDGRFFEQPPTHLETTIRIRNLVKNYDNVRVVNKINLDVFKGEITALLGRNGAGKTTTMSILTGLTAPTAGTIHFGNLDVFNNMKTFRQHIGLCPQENRLMSYLTVMDHLWFFGKLRDLPNEKIIKDADYYLEQLEMREQKSILALYLPSDTKRKLCLAISLIGNPDVLILDEPTTGIDIQSRRKIWDLLLGLRRDRSIILTTHFMEEADTLGDRIAIMHQGVIVCHGTPIFLKKQYGTGYELTITKTVDDARDLTNAILRAIPIATKEYETYREVVYRLPLTETAHFPRLFKDLETRKLRYGILSMGITCTTMEQVFLKVGGITDYKSIKYSKDKITSEKEFILDYQKISSQMLLIVQQMLALFLKKYLYTKRRIFNLITRVLLPSIIVLLALVLFVGDKFVDLEPSLEFSLKTYPDVKVLISKNYNHRENLFDNYLNWVEDEGADVTVITDTDINQALLDAGRKDIITYNRNLMLAVEFSDGSIKLLYNSIGIHAFPLAINVFSNALLQAFTANSSVRIEAFNKPVSQSARSCRSKEIKGLFSYVWIFALAFYTIDVVMYPIGFANMERIGGFKHIQFMSNVPPLVYWSSMLFFDLLFFFLVIAFRVILFKLFDDSFNFLEFAESFWVLIFVMFAYGVSGLLFIYVISFLLHSRDGAYTTFFILNFLITILMMVYYLFESNSFTVTGLKSIESSAAEVFLFYLIKGLILLLPPINFCLLFYKFLNIWSANSACANCPLSLKASCEGNLTEINYLEYASLENPDGMLLGIQFLVVDAILYAVILALISGGYIQYWINEWRNWFYGTDSTNNDEGDSDVVTENDRVQATLNDSSSRLVNAPLLVNGLRKNFVRWFRPFTAVTNTSFILDRGECFGVLGPNGAGKTTTFQILTAQILPTMGDAYIEGISLGVDRMQYLSMTGYCSQKDNFIEELTGREMLTLIAALRGVVKNDIANVVEKWISILELNRFQNQRCGYYSNGNKRKLCAAMSLIGNPAVVFLDEPTSGVDAVSKRRLYEVIGQSKQTGQVVVLSSHSMEECENVCDRITIMTGGVMRCLGSVEHLRRKYAQGFSVAIKLRHDVDPAEEAEELKNDMMFVFTPEYCFLKDEYGSLLYYQITDTSLPWSILFQNMEYIKYSYQTIVEDYVLTDTSLEEVFMSFVQQENPQVFPDE